MGIWTNLLTDQQRADMEGLAIDWDARCEEQLRQISRDAAAKRYEAVVDKARQLPAEKQAELLAAVDAQVTAEIAKAKH